MEHMNKRAYVPGRRSPAFVDPDRVQKVRRGLVSMEGAAALADTFSILDDPTRARLLHALAIDELCVSDLAALLGISASSVSHQLRLLRSRRLVGLRREGKHCYYRLEDAHIRSLVELGLTHVNEER
jgi:ArsR family transcriptional regulator, lead/cadmium/zinc/bismuth-responsive transcriptional repressor